MAKLAPEELQKRLLKALKVGHDLYSPEDLGNAVKDGRMQCFQKGQSILVTEVLGYPKGLVLNIFLAVGDHDEVVDLLPDVYEFARSQKCKLIHMSGRKGWLKTLEKCGWKQDKITMTKEL